MALKTGTAREFGTLSGIWDTIYGSSATLQDIGITFDMTGGEGEVASTAGYANYIAQNPLSMTGTITGFYKAGTVLTGAAFSGSGSGHYLTGLRRWSLNIARPAIQTGTVSANGSGEIWANFIRDDSYEWSGDWEAAVDDDHADYEDLNPTSPGDSSENLVLNVDSTSVISKFEGGVIRTSGNNNHTQRQIATTTQGFRGTGALTVAGTGNIFGVTASGAALPTTDAASQGTLSFRVADGSADDSLGYLVSGSCMWTQIAWRVSPLELVQVDITFQSLGAVTVTTPSAS